MVAYETLTFPKSQSTALNSSNGQLLGTASVPYHSTDGINKPIYLNVPAGFTFTGNVSTANPMTITVSNMTKPSTINVFKNGVFLTTTPNLDPYTSASSKQFVLANTTGVVYFSSYFYNINTAYVPLDPGVAGTTDVYTFYAPFAFTMSSSSSTPLTYIAGTWSYGVVINTSISTSAFTNFSYSSGSSDTGNFASYLLQSSLNTNSVWTSGNTNGYVPTTLSSLWTGLYQLAILYVNQIFVTNNLNFKNMGTTNTIQWLDADANGSGYMGLIYCSLSSGAMNFIINSTKLVNGFIFNGAVAAPSATLGTLSVTGTASTNSLGVTGSITGASATLGTLSVTGATSTNSLGVTGAITGGSVTVGTLKLNNTANIKGMACGTTSGSSNGTVTVNFGFTFTNTPVVTASPNYAGVAYILSVMVISVNTTSFQYNVLNWNGSTPAHFEQFSGVNWIAIGT